MRLSALWEIISRDLKEGIQVASRSFAGAMVLLFFWVGPALGQYDDYEYEVDYTRRGLYLAMSGVAGFEDFEKTGYTADNSLGLSLAAGYRLHPNFAIEIGTSFGPLKGRIWRIGAMGYNCRKDAVLTTLAAFEATLRLRGYAAPPGAGVDAALKVYNSV